MTPETLRELEALYERATPGVWSTDHSGLVTGGEYEQIAKGGKIQCPSDARWIVALHNHFPALLAEIRRLEAERDEYKAAMVNALADVGRYGSELAKMRNERDELRAECERLRARADLLEVVAEASRDFHCNYAGGCGCDICEAFLQLDAFDRRAALTPSEKEKPLDSLVTDSHHDWERQT